MLFEPKIISQPVNQRKAVDKKYTGYKNVNAPDRASLTVKSAMIM